MVKDFGPVYGTDEVEKAAESYFEQKGALLPDGLEVFVTENGGDPDFNDQMLTETADCRPGLEFRLKSREGEPAVAVSTVKVRLSYEPQKILGVCLPKPEPEPQKFTVRYLESILEAVEPGDYSVKVLDSKGQERLTSGKTYNIFDLGEHLMVYNDEESVSALGEDLVVELSPLLSQFFSLIKGVKG